MGDSLSGVMSYSSEHYGLENCDLYSNNSGEDGGLAGTRTPDQCLKRALLYQLSYQPPERSRHSNGQFLFGNAESDVRRGPPIVSVTRFLFFAVGSVREAVCYACATGGLTTFLRD